MNTKLDTKFVNVGNAQSKKLSCDIGCPQGCVLSPILFSVYTDFIKLNCDNVKVIKYADDMAIIGLELQTANYITKLFTFYWAMFLCESYS